METTPREAELTARLERLEKTVSGVTAQLENALCENERLRTENKLLREKVDKLVRRIFGKSSEKMDPAQLELLLQFPEEDPVGKSLASPCSGPGADTWEASPDPRRQPRPVPERRPRLPEHLPVVEQIIEPVEVLHGERDAWRRIGEEISEQLDYEPARFLRRRTVRPKYVRRGDMEQPPVIAPLPPSLQDACLAAPGLIAAIIVSKYCDHLPLYRQEMIYQTKHGVTLPRQPRPLAGAETDCRRQPEGRGRRPESTRATEPSTQTKFVCQNPAENQESKTMNLEPVPPITP